LSINLFFKLDMDNWHWRSWNDLPYLTCSLLEQWPHGFFTQPCWPRSPRELVGILNPEAPVYRLKQVHGNTVLSTERLTPDGPEMAVETSPVGESRPEGDGLLTTEAGQSVWVCTADCAPVLIADERTGQVAAVHAGWRGTAAEIVPEAIVKFQRQGSELHDLRLAIGPAIAGEVYQVSEEVAAQVCATIVNTIPENFSLDAIYQLPQPPILEDPQPERVRLDVRRAIALQVEQLGIPAANVAIAPHCTYQEPEKFFSYRRDGQKKVQWSAIVSQGKD
jgi:YfiH family protein